MYFISSVTSVFVLKRLNKDIQLKLIYCLGYFFLSAFSFRFSSSGDSSLQPPSQSHSTSVRCILLGRTGEKHNVPHPKICIVETIEKNPKHFTHRCKRRRLTKPNSGTNISKANEHFFTLLFILNNVKGLGLFHLLFLGCLFLPCKSGTYVMHCSTSYPYCHGIIFVLAFFRLLLLNCVSLYGEEENIAPFYYFIQISDVCFPNL